jgi:hypothetical protein
MYDIIEKSARADTDKNSPQDEPRYFSSRDEDECLASTFVLQGQSKKVQVTPFVLVDAKALNEYFVSWNVSMHLCCERWNGFLVLPKFVGWSFFTF